VSERVRQSTDERAKLVVISIYMINKFIQYIKDSRLELQKVVWPKRKSLINSTLVVIFFSLSMAAFLGIIDFGLTKLIQLIIS